MIRRIRRRPFVAGVLATGLVLGGIWVVKLVQLARSPGTHATYWSQPRGEAGGLLYVALGDSAAQGIGASDPQHGYVALLADRLREATGRPVEVVNLSSSGAHIADVLDDQVPALDALSRAPDVVTVAVGGNDVRAYGRAAFAAQAEQLAARLPDGSYLADAPYFMHGRWERDAAEAGELLRQAAKSEGLRPVGSTVPSRRRGGRRCSPPSLRTGSTPTTEVTGWGPTPSGSRCRRTSSRAERPARAFSPSRLRRQHRPP